jgi:hypothetical protein
MHYTTTGIEESDRTCIALRFADPAAVHKEVATKLMFEPNLAIPPGEANYHVEQTWRFNDAVLVFALFPHMHLRGKSFRYEALYADGTEEILLDVPRFDFAWQPSYTLAEPKRLPAGTSLRCSAIFDNSQGNPANPDPTALVRTGTQSWEEMFNGYFDVALADQDLTGPPPLSARLILAARRVLPRGVAALLAAAFVVFLARRPLAATLATADKGTGK